VTNLFVYESAAKRYAAARPWFHPIVAERIVQFTKIRRFAYAVDAGCGTGQSSRAIAAIADFVDALDVSPEMIAEADEHPRVRYRICPAEHLDHDLATVDLITAGLAFHWFDQPRFLSRAAECLKSGAWLIIYNHGFCGEMQGDGSFARWSGDEYLRRFPAPARRAIGVAPELMAPHGLCPRGQEEFFNDEQMTAEQLTRYLLTQTNVIAAVECGSMALEAATQWIAEGVAPFFAGQQRTLKFGGTIWYVQKQ
jgi:SAM-dependent methyltransferase